MPDLKLFNWELVMKTSSVTDTGRAPMAWSGIEDPLLLRIVGPPPVSIPEKYPIRVNTFQTLGTTILFNVVDGNSSSPHQGYSVRQSGRLSTTSRDGFIYKNLVVTTNSPLLSFILHPSLLFSNSFSIVTVWTGSDFHSFFYTIS
ncbi:hypothetical protein QSH57_011434 [Fusarium oxysporum f. sp. vasinfectum]|jgi:hypothetical protein|nr:hypothetical protein QSH57_011434 [Fusarium oxysporum f. sp. vasinfectum]